MLAAEGARRDRRRIATSHLGAVLARRKSRTARRAFVRWFIEAGSSSRERALLKEMGSLRALNHAFKRQLLMGLSMASDARDSGPDRHQDERFGDGTRGAPLEI